MRMLVLERFRIGHLGHVELMLEARLGELKRGCHREYLLAMLDGDDAARREARAVAAAVDFVKYRHLGIAAAQEIGMKRVTLAALHGSRRGYQRLPKHLPAKHALFFYKGMGFFFDAAVVKEASRWVEELMSALALDRHVEVYVGPPDAVIHGTQYRQERLGTIESVTNGVRTTQSG